MAKFVYFSLKKIHFFCLKNQKFEHFMSKNIKFAYIFFLKMLKNCQFFILKIFLKNKPIFRRFWNPENPVLSRIFLKIPSRFEKSNPVPKIKSRSEKNQSRPAGFNTNDKILRKSQKSGQNHGFQKRQMWRFLQNV